MCLFPSVGRIFSIGPARFRPGVRTRIVFVIAPVVKKRSRSRGVSKIEPYAFPSSFSRFFALPNCAYFPRWRSYFRIFGTSLEWECDFYGFWGRAGSSSIFLEFLWVLSSEGQIQPNLQFGNGFCRISRVISWFPLNLPKLLGSTYIHKNCNIPCVFSHNSVFSLLWTIYFRRVFLWKRMYVQALWAFN